MTVSKSYGLLEEEGVLTRRPGLSLVVSESSRGVATSRPTVQLELLLEPAAVASRQLGVSEEDALEAFRRVLANLPATEEAEG